MLYFLAVLLPPVAVFMAGGRPMQAMLNLLLTLLGWIPGVVHAFLVVNEHKADKRSEKQAQIIAKAQRRE